MSIHTATTGVGQVTVEAKVIRADGRVDDLGTIAYWHRNPFKRLAWRIRRLLARIS